MHRKVYVFILVKLFCKGKVLSYKKTLFTFKNLKNIYFLTFNEKFNDNICKNSNLLIE